ncbi:hypothetical protein [Chryseobacterium sp. A321]
MKSFLNLLVFSFLVSACTQNTSHFKEGSISKADPFEINPLEQIAITSSIQSKQKTMSTLYGNEIAANYAWTGSGKEYPSEAILYQVTWGQKEDSVWFGALIPADIKSVEIIKFHQEDEGDETEGRRLEYKKYEGSPLALATESKDKEERIQYILNQNIARVP